MRHPILYLAFAGALQAGHPLTGHWQFNFEKSPGSTPEISKFERDGDFIVNTNGAIRARFQFDGKPYPATSEQFDTVIWRQTGPRQFEHETKKAGRTVYAVATEVAADGRTRTYRNTRYLEGGKTLVNEGVQERIGGPTDASNPLVGHWRLPRLMEWNAESDKVTMSSGALQFTAATDGKDYPAASSRADAVALRRQGGFGVEVRAKKNGKVVFTNVYQVDGNKLTVTGNGPGVGLWERTR